VKPQVPRNEIVFPLVIEDGDDENDSDGDDDFVD